MAQFNSQELDAWFVNLDGRPDRRRHMVRELSRIGLEARRFRAFKPHEWDGPPEQVQAMRDRTPGAIGCHMSQVAVMRTARTTGRNVMILEDDVVFADDFHERLKYIEKNLTWDWDIFWLGATFHVNPPVWHKDTLGRDVECTSDPRIMRTYGIWSTYAWIVNSDSVDKIDRLFTENLHKSWGIDHLAIQLQPQLKTFCFVPGCAWQYDNRSSIGSGITKFSGFKKLGPYAWTTTMDQFDPTTFDWKEAKVNGNGHQAPITVG